MDKVIRERPLGQRVHPLSVERETLSDAQGEVRPIGEFARDADGRLVVFRPTAVRGRIPKARMPLQQRADLDVVSNDLHVRPFVEHDRQFPVAIVFDARDRQRRRRRRRDAIRRGLRRAGRLRLLLLKGLFHFVGGQPRQDVALVLRVKRANTVVHQPSRCHGHRRHHGRHRQQANLRKSLLGNHLLSRSRFQMRFRPVPPRLSTSRYYRIFSDALHDGTPC